MLYLSFKTLLFGLLQRILITTTATVAVTIAGRLFQIPLTSTHTHTHIQERERKREREQK